MQENITGYKYVIYNGREHYVPYGYENHKQFILVDNQKVFENAPVYFEYTNQGLNKGTYIDCCKPFDKYNWEIHEGDQLYACVKGEVEQVKVVKIADKPYHVGYGVHRRKITVVSVTDEKKKWILPDGSKTIKP